MVQGTLASPCALRWQVARCTSSMVVIEENLLPSTRTWAG